MNSGGFVPNEPYRLETIDRLQVLHRAIEARDADGARDAMLHIDRSFQQRLAEGYPRQFDRVVCWPEVAATDQPAD